MPRLGEGAGAPAGEQCATSARAGGLARVGWAGPSRQVADVSSTSGLVTVRLHRAQSPGVGVLGAQELGDFGAW